MHAAIPQQATPTQTYWQHIGKVGSPLQSCDSSTPDGRPTGSYPATGLEEIKADLLEADFAVLIFAARAFLCLRLGGNCNAVSTTHDPSKQGWRSRGCDYQNWRLAHKECFRAIRNRVSGGHC